MDYLAEVKEMLKQKDDIIFNVKSFLIDKKYLIEKSKQRYEIDS